MVDNNEMPLVTGYPLLSTNIPENVKLEAPFALLPLVTIYVINKLLPLIGFFPKILSPNKISYFSSAISCSKNILLLESTLKIFEYCLYSSIALVFTKVLIVDVSTLGFGIINL